DRGGQQALLGGTKVILDGNVPLRQKVPIALDLRNTLDNAPRGVVPNLAAPFDKRGAAHDPSLAHLRDSLVSTLEDAIPRTFRSSCGLAPLFALLALGPILAARRLVGA